jgi:hypothetical protein
MLKNASYRTWLQTSILYIKNCPPENHFTSGGEMSFQPGALFWSWDRTVIKFSINLSEFNFCQ